MKQVAWREDDFEERKINPSWFVSGGANTVVEAESFLYSAQPDVIYTGPHGVCVFEIKYLPKAYEQDIAFLCLLSRTYRGPIPEQTPIVLARSSIAGLTHHAEANSTVSSWQDREQEKLAARSPLTKRVYEHLANIPKNYRSFIENLLDEFVAIVPQSKAPKLPPLRVTDLGDSSYLLEWTFKDRRLGFSLEPDSKDSGWYYVFARDSSEHYESGTMDQLEIKRLVLQAMNA